MVVILLTLFTLQESKIRLDISFQSQRLEFAGGYFIRYLMYVIGNALGQGNIIRLTIIHANISFMLFRRLPDPSKSFGFGNRFEDGRSNQK
jgi:hypothetical protein